MLPASSGYAGGMATASEGRLTSRPAGPAPVDVRPGVVGIGDGGLLLVPRKAAQPASLLVFFHGAGGHASRSLPLVEDVAEARGSLVLLPSSVGPTWDLLTGRLGVDVRPLDAALAQVFAGHDVDRVAFGGFSDGASYALSLGLANGDLAEAVLAFSPGFAAPPAQVGLLRFWVSHGTADAVLPIDQCGRRVVRLLGDAGYDVHFEEFEGGHVVPQSLVTSAYDWWL